MKFRKLPVEIEAMQYPGHSIDGVDKLLAFEDWLEPRAKAAKVWPMRYTGQMLVVRTLEGEMHAQPGDWIICGVAGEIYPCKPDIFSKTYEPVQ